ncbi:IS21 family transposase [Sulfidibacter corallicola]|nr:helix-turn-helix domain-containing protein [Sulfidibacter corallicola]QTD54227.1 helix-turn-helix domain-containing protein [Sulfidibacter corallicola]
MLSEPIREQIKKLHQQGTPLREISRQTGVSRNAIRRLIRR